MTCRPAADDSLTTVCRGRVELLEPHQQQPRQVGSDAGLSPHARGGDLLCEERVALRTLDHRLDLAIGEPAHPSRVQPAHQLAHRGTLKGGEVDAAHLGEPGPVRQRGPQRVAPVQVVTAERDHQRDGAEETPSQQETEQLARRLVRPVHVLDHHQQRLGGRKVLETGVQALEEIAAVGLRRLGGGAAEVGLQERPEGGVGGDQVIGHLRLVGEQTAEELDEREVGEGAAGLTETVPDHDPPAVVTGALRELGEQPGLAHAGVAGQHDQAPERLGSSGRSYPGGGGEAIEVLVASDDGPEAGRVQWHSLDYAGGHRHGAARFQAAWLRRVLTDSAAVRRIGARRRTAFLRPATQGASRPRSRRYSVSALMNSKSP